MKKIYITPETEVLTINLMQSMLAGSVEGLGENAEELGLRLAGKGEEEDEADAKEFAFEDDPWQNGSSNNYWE